jgi:two-component system nitrogen regulation sensor histidine kinase NtrY
MILLATVALLVLLGLVAAQLARTVSRPVRELAAATGRIGAGDYETRLVPRTHDEVAGLVVGFNAMASALLRQRADLEEQRDYMETLLRHDTTGVISLDPQGRIVTRNPAADGLLRSRGGLPAAGSDLASALEASPALRPLAAALRAPAGHPADVDLVLDGEPRRLRAVRVELHKASGEDVGTLILLDDVTDLMRSNQLAAWAEMARVIAHEIKNPLTPIQLSSEHLRRLLADRQIGAEPAVVACLDTIAKQVRALYEIAGEFSTYAKLPVLDPQPTDPVALVSGVVAPYRLGAAAGLVVEEEYRTAPPIAADRRVLSRAIVNLVENAVQAMAEGGTLRVGVAHEPARDEVVLSVGDTGPGLAPEVRARLFEPYFSTKSGGTGLGLAIVRRAVEAHAGRIEVESDRGRGTRFRLHFPVHRPA